MPKERLEILTELKPENFKPLTGDFSERLRIAADNVLSMFDIEKHKRTAKAIIRIIGENEKPLSINDFAWTPEVERAFFDHPNHEGLEQDIYDHKAGFSWEMAMPMNTDKDGNYVDLETRQQLKEEKK